MGLFESLKFNYSCCLQKVTFLRDQESHTYSLTPAHSKVPNQAPAAAERLHHSSAVPGLLTFHRQHSRLEKWHGSTIGQQLLFWNFPRFLKQTNRQTNKWKNIKLQSFLHWFQMVNSWFPWRSRAVQETAADRSPASDLPQLCTAYAARPVSHQRCSPGQQLEAAAGSSGCIHLWAVLAGWQVGIQVLLAPLQVVEVWVRQGTVGRYSFGWIKCQTLLW